MKRIAPYLSDSVLVRGLDSAIVHEATATALVLDHIAEFDARRLYLPAAYPSTYAYCVGRLHLSEDAAYKRIQAARAAARFPAIFDLVADNRLHMSGACLLAPHLSEETAGELLAAATHKTKAQIERLLAERFPRPDLPTRVQEIAMASVAAPAPPPLELAPGQVAGRLAPEHAADGRDLASPASAGAPELAPGQVAGPLAPEHPADGRPLAPPATAGAPELAPGQVPSPFGPPPMEDRARLKPLAPRRFALQVTIDEETHDALRYAQELLGPEIRSGDVARVIALALQALIPQLERRRFAATDNPRPGRRTSASARQIPADVKRAVWKRDGGRCAFVSETGDRCTERTGLEYDHVEPVARGGEATVAGVRLLCAAHNQFEAERAFGSEFMRHKRLAAAEARERAMGRAAGERGG